MVLCSNEYIARHISLLAHFWVFWSDGTLQPLTRWPRPHWWRWLLCVYWVPRGNGWLLWPLDSSAWMSCVHLTLLHLQTKFTLSSFCLCFCMCMCMRALVHITSSSSCSCYLGWWPTYSAQLLSSVSLLLSLWTQLHTHSKSLIMLFHFTF